MAIISVRVASDIPIQSDYLPLISLYFILSLFYTFISLNWFVLLNHFRSKNSLPKFLESLAVFYKLFCFGIKEFTCNKNKIRSFKADENKNETENNNKFEDLISKINFLAFSLLFVSMFSSNLAIWLVISN